MLCRPRQPDPVEAIKYHMDQNGLQPRDLIPFIGSRNRSVTRCSITGAEAATLRAQWRALMQVKAAANSEFVKLI